MKPLPRATFLPWRDPLCVLSWLLYAFNRWALIPRFGASVPFLQQHLGDALLIPAALPVLYWLRFRLGLRATLHAPTWREVLLWCVGWSLFFEWFGPHFLHHSVGDWADVAAYFVGGILAAAWWNRVWPRR